LIFCLLLISFDKIHPILKICEWSGINKRQKTAVVGDSLLSLIMTAPAAKRVCADARSLITAEEDCDGNERRVLDGAVLSALLHRYGRGNTRCVWLQLVVRGATDGTSLHQVDGGLAWTLLRLLTCSAPAAVPDEQVLARATLLFESGRRLWLHLPAGGRVLLDDFFDAFDNTDVRELPTRPIQATCSPTCFTLSFASPDECSGRPLDFLPSDNTVDA
jgi:hypothetical protein